MSGKYKPKLKNVNKEEQFWNKVITACVTEFPWGENALKQAKSKGWPKTMAGYLRDMDEAEFKIFLAKVVIEASGQGVVGADLSAQIEALRELRAR